MIASADGRTAYVSNYGGGSLHTLAVVDLVGQKAMPAIELEPLHGPHGLTFVGGKTWFTAEGSKVIGRYDPATGAAGIVMQPDGEPAFVACSPDDYVTVIDLKTMEVVGKIDAGGEPDGMAWAVRK